MGNLMSTIKANDLQTTTGGIPTVKGQRLIPTAWVTFAGEGTAAIDASENVSSVTDRGTGLYTANFTTAMANIDYCYQGTTMDGGGENDITGIGCSSGGKTTTGVAVYTYHGIGGFSLNDANKAHITILGGQA